MGAKTRECQFELCIEAEELHVKLNLFALHYEPRMRLDLHKLYVFLNDSFSKNKLARVTNLYLWDGW